MQLSPASSTQKVPKTTTRNADDRSVAGSDLSTRITSNPGTSSIRSSLSGADSTASSRRCFVCRLREQRPLKVLLTCGTCNKYYHPACHSPILNIWSQPAEKWSCSKCLANEKSSNDTMFRNCERCTKANLTNSPVCLACKTKETSRAADESRRQQQEQRRSGMANRLSSAFSKNAERVARGSENEISAPQKEYFSDSRRPSESLDTRKDDNSNYQPAPIIHRQISNSRLQLPSPLLNPSALLATGSEDIFTSKPLLNDSPGPQIALISPPALRRTSGVVDIQKNNTPGPTSNASGKAPAASIFKSTGTHGQASASGLKTSTAEPPLGPPGLGDEIASWSKPSAIKPALTSSPVITNNSDRKPSHQTGPRAIKSAIRFTPRKRPLHESGKGDPEKGERDVKILCKGLKETILSPRSKEKADKHDDGDEKMPDRGNDPPEERQTTPKAVVPVTATIASKQVLSTGNFDKIPEVAVPSQDVQRSPGRRGSPAKEENGNLTNSKELFEDKSSSYPHRALLTTRVLYEQSSTENINGVQVLGFGIRSSGITAAPKADVSHLASRGLDHNEAEINKDTIELSKPKVIGPGVARKSAAKQTFRPKSPETRKRQRPPAEAGNSLSARKDSPSRDLDVPIKLLLTRNSARKSASYDVPKDDSDEDIAIEEAKVQNPCRARKSTGDEGKQYKSPYAPLGSLPKATRERDVPDTSASRMGAALLDISRRAGSKVSLRQTAREAGRKYAQSFNGSEPSGSDDSNDSDEDVIMEDVPPSRVPQPKLHTPTAVQADPDPGSESFDPEISQFLHNLRVFSSNPLSFVPANRVDLIPVYDPPPESLEYQRRIRASTYDPSKLDGYIYRPRPPLEQPGFDNFREDPEYIHRQAAIRARGGKKGQYGVTLSVAQILENRAKGWLRGQNSEVTEQKLKIWMESKKLDGNEDIVEGDGEERIAGMANPRYVVAGMKDGKLVFGDVRKKNEDGKQIYFD